MSEALIDALVQAGRLYPESTTVLRELAQHSERLVAALLRHRIVSSDEVDRALVAHFSREGSSKANAHRASAAADAKSAAMPDSDTQPFAGKTGPGNIEPPTADGSFAARPRMPIADTHHAAGASAADGSAIRLLTELLDGAARRGASDLHLEPDGDAWRVRFRIDGVLSEVARPAAALRELLITRVKVLAGLDIAERRLPQDGRLTITNGTGESQDYRVNTLPTTAGEKLVLRRLQTLPLNLTLADLGFDDAQRRVLEDAIHAPHGMILVTGPTGSGKTVSLYSFLQQLDRRSFNICTVEDPAEIRLAGINQVGIHEKAGLSFAQTLRAFLRQDPDVIMVGEIRDAETASVAIKAAQTGHLVFSTLHTNDAPATLARLLDIGVEPFNIAAAVRLITAQRLLRKLCTACRAPITISSANWRAASGTEAMQTDGFRPYKAVGCAVCHGTGYRGRTGIHQVMPVSEAMRQIIVARGSASELGRQALCEGVTSLRCAALTKVAQGEASLEEAVCATDRLH